MGFRYDFDMFSVMPDEIQQEFQGFLSEIGMESAVSEQVALFRDPALVQALSSADEKVKNLFLEAGFGLNVYDSGAPEGRYLARDEAGRNRCMRKLTENIAASKNLNKADWGGFNPQDFLDYYIAATPIEQGETPANENAEPAPKKKRSIACVGIIAGGAMIVTSAIGILVGSFAG